MFMVSQVTDETIRKIYEDMDVNNVKWLNLQFTDLLGNLRQVVIKRRNDFKWFEELVRNGIGKLDGSSVPGFQDIYDSDMNLKPDPLTYAYLPWTEQPTARLICNVLYREESYAKDPRSNLEKALKNLLSRYVPYIGVEIEFFILKGINIVHNEEILNFSVNMESDELPINNNGYTYDWKGGYYIQPANDTLFKYRENLVTTLEKYFNIYVESHHHEVGIAGQSEVNIRYSDPLVTSDNFITFKQVAKMVGRDMGFIPIFMPKPIPIDNGSGLHMHISLYRDDENIFYDADDEYAMLSQTARYFIGGLIEHGRALSALVSPTVNSYRRLIPGYEAPVYLVWSRSNRSAAIRVPFYSRRYGGGRIEYRPPDPSCNLYIASAAVLAAGIDGINKKLDPGDPVDEDIYRMPQNKRVSMGIKTLPRDLWEALDELESDNKFLEGYLSRELIETYIELKRREYIYLVKYASTAEYKMYSSI